MRIKTAAVATIIAFGNAASLAVADTTYIIVRPTPTPSIIQMPSTCSTSCLNALGNAAAAFSAMFAKRPRVASTPSTVAAPIAAPLAAASTAVRFHGYVCATDCLYAKAGYGYGLDRGYTSVAQCPTVSLEYREFAEGCWAAAGRDGYGPLATPH